LEQLEKLFWIVEKTDKVENKIGVKAIPRILCICDNLNLLKGIIKRMRANKAFRVDGIEQLMFFNLDVNVWSNFGSGRVNLKGEKISLEDIKPFVEVGQNGTNGSNVSHNKVITLELNFPFSNHAFSSTKKN